MDWQIESTSVMFIGAGFSTAASDGKLPLMTGYFDRLRQSEFPDLYGFVTEVGCNKTCEHIELANIERVLLAFDQIRTSPEALLEDWLGEWKPKLQTIQQQLSLYTLARLRAGLCVSPDNWAVQLLARCGPRTSVISMNYDNIAEQVLSNRAGMRHGDYSPTCPHCKMRLLLHRACSCDSRDSISDESWRAAIIKPHGSISWRRCINPDCCSYECLVADKQCQPFEPCECPHCSAICSPVMVMSTMSKNLDEMPEISTMWQAARHALKDAESILFFGFSFPESDELLMQLIRFACKDGRNLRKVGAIDLEPEKVLQRFESCLPLGYHVETVPIPVERDTVPIWFDVADPALLFRMKT